MKAIAAMLGVFTLTGILTVQAIAEGGAGANTLDKADAAVEQASKGMNKGRTSTKTPFLMGKIHNQGLV